MKTKLAMAVLAFVAGASVAKASGFNEAPLITSSPTLSLYVTTTGDKVRKDVMEMAFEDAVKFVGSEGKGEISEALKAAIDEVNEKLAAAGKERVDDLQAATVVILINMKGFQ